jgi:hypothetical protein
MREREREQKVACLVFDDYLLFRETIYCMNGILNTYVPVRVQPR